VKFMAVRPGWTGMVKRSQSGEVCEGALNSRQLVTGAGIKPGHCLQFRLARQVAAARAEGAGSHPTQESRSVHALRGSAPGLRY